MAEKTGHAWREATMTNEKTGESHQVHYCDKCGSTRVFVEALDRNVYINNRGQIRPGAPHCKPAESWYTSFGKGYTIT
jgi:hypothetical protein